MRITNVETRTATIRVNNTNVEYKIATYSFQDPLSRDFVGVSALQRYNSAKPATILRDSIVADTGKYYASVELADDVAVGSFTLQAESIFSQLIHRHRLKRLCLISMQSVKILLWWREIAEPSQHNSQLT